MNKRQKKLLYCAKKYRIDSGQTLSLINLLTLALMLPLVTFPTGCRIGGTFDAKKDFYYINPKKDMSGISRVTVVELDNESSYPEMSNDMTGALFLALQKKQVFGLTVVRRQDPVWRSLQMDLGLPYTLERLLATQTTLKCDAILVGTITEYHPYPHMAVGLRMKLVDLKDGEMLWAFEQVWDAADKSTEYRIKHYLQQQTRSRMAAMREELAIVSTLDFTKFVAYEVADTIKAGK